MNILLSSNMGAIINLTALAILTLFTLIGLIKGFVKTFVQSFGTILSIIFSALLAVSMLNFLQSKIGIVDFFAEKLSGLLTDIFGESIMNTSIKEATETTLLNSGLTSWIITLIINAKNDGTIDKSLTLNQIITPAFSYYLSIIICAVVLYILFRIAFFLLGQIFSKIRKFKLVKKTDTILGSILGLVRGIFIISLITSIINIIPIAFFQNLSIEIADAPITSFLNNINIFNIVLNTISNPANIIGFIK